MRAQVEDDLQEYKAQHTRFEKRDALKMKLGAAAGMSMTAGGGLALMVGFIVAPAVVGFAAMPAAVAACCGVMGGGAAVSLVSLHDDIRAVFTHGLRAAIKKYEEGEDLLPKL